MSLTARTLRQLTGRTQPVSTDRRASHDQEGPLPGLPAYTVTRRCATPTERRRPQRRDLAAATGHDPHVPDIESLVWPPAMHRPALR
jgi:hypothetical protein